MIHYNILFDRSTHIIDFKRQHDIQQYHCIYFHIFVFVSCTRMRDDDGDGDDHDDDDDDDDDDDITWTVASCETRPTTVNRIQIG